MGAAKSRECNFTRLDFMKYVHKADSGCWEWRAAKIRGYGAFRGWRAHRASWLLFRGADPGERHVCHHCDNPSCVNPDHLFLGDPKINADDRTAKGRNKNPVGEAHASARLTNAQATEIRRLANEGAISQREIARQFGTTQSNVAHIKKGKYWRCINVGG